MEIDERVNVPLKDLNFVIEDVDLSLVIVVA